MMRNSPRRPGPSALGSISVLLLGLSTTACGTPRSPSATRDADVIVVGAGIAGLSAAWEARGFDVLVMDVSSVYGGHAVSAHGGLAIVDSDIQRAAGIIDTPELAYGDFVSWGEDADEEWVRYYVDSSRDRIYDWAMDRGVEFEDLMHMAGNTVPRFHNVKGRGLGLVTPIYKQDVSAGVRFEWNTRVEELILEDGRVVGVRGRNERTGEVLERRAPAVVLATGGFQSNLDRVRKNWNPELPYPDRILAGSGWNSQGSGLDLARQAGAQMHRLDHQWNYVTGLPDPRYPDENRGLNVLADHAVWVNVEGERFIDECAAAKHAFPALMREPTGSYWAVLDSRGRESLMISGSGWSDEKVDALIFRNPDLVKTASSVAELAELAGIPEGALVGSIARFNRMVDEGIDSQFGRFGEVGEFPLPCQEIAKLDSPPFYAMHLYPLARKSMGGIKIDRRARVLDTQDQPIPGLFAAGEAAGFGGINGKAGLEGTFLGPSILTGREAGASAIRELSGLNLTPRGEPRRHVSPEVPAEPQFENSECTACHDLRALIEPRRNGYWHFELVHARILEQGLNCSRCHSELFPFNEDAHTVDPLLRVANCVNCHGLQAID